ncbi:hypothetical protein [Methylococcus geothermalis]|uniref:DUF2232 domain-containing protein n=1 Tax=Methylococcus geothermalis TaxID=2681310 RepID=A0A858Q8G7_9GAMM|nr:hypothetical protein [Methylococcus geothermalis]QJD30120.1 hypothetical protein GNH96_09155 [Methylococcus geothermalis]
MREVMRDFAGLIMRGTGFAFLIAGLLGMLSLYFLPAASFSAAAVGLVALRLGTARGVFLALAIAVPVAACGYLFPPRPGLELPLLVLLCPLVLGAAALLLRGGKQGPALLFIGAVCMAGVIAIELISGDATAFWRSWLQHAVKGVRGATVQGFEENGTLVLMNGLMAFLIGGTAFLTLLLARWWQSLLYNPDQFGPEFQRLRLPRPALAAAVALVVIAHFWRPALQMHLLLVGIMVYAFQGLAVVHGVVAQRGIGWIGWLPPYLALVFVPQFGTVGLAALGAVDALANFRRLPAAKSRTP